MHLKIRKDSFNAMHPPAPQHLLVVAVVMCLLSSASLGFAAAEPHGYILEDPDLGRWEVRFHEGAQGLCEVDRDCTRSGGRSLKITKTGPAE